ncbi:MAG: PDZ domain-containing protein [Patescibacteria group bacterium]
MKKLLLVLFGVIIIIVIVQKFGLLTYFFNNNKLILNNQASITPTATISQIINRPIIGIHYKMIDKQTASQNRLTEGAYVTQVIKGSLAEKADIREEDIITEIDGRIIVGLNEQSVYNLISTLKSGTKINLKIWRNKEIKNILVTLDSTQ